MEDRQFHINCAAGEIGKYVLLTGDPDRVPEIAAHLEHSRKVAQKREFTTYTGALECVPVSVISTGIGGPSAVIAMEECVALCAHTMIRIGTCGGMQPELIPGTLILPTGAIRMEGTTREYLPLEFPAVPDFDLLCSLTAAAAERGCRYRTGVVQCKDSFYGQHSPQTMPVRQKLLDSYRKSGREVPFVDDIYASFPANERDDCKKVLENLVSCGELVMLTPQLFYHKDVYEEVCALTRDFFEGHPAFTLAEYRDLLGTSRKYALAILEFFDKTKVTKMVGDHREVIGSL